MRRLIKRFRFGVRLIKAFFHRHFFIIALGCFFGVFSFLALPQFLLPRSSLKEIRIGLVGRFDEASIPQEITQLASLGLTELLPEGIATSSVAKSWEVFDEGKVYKFYLRDDLFWTDGTRFTAKDINYEFKNAKIEVISDFQIKITLKEPFSPLPALVSRPFFKKKMLGLGDYQLINFQKSGRFLEKVVLKPVRGINLPDINYRFYTTEEAARLGFKLGEINKLEGIVSPKELKIWPGLKITPTVSKSRYAAVFLNLKNPKLKEKSFRQALAYAIEKEKGEKRAYGPISPNSWTYNTMLKPYTYDLDHAKDLLGKTKNEESIELLAFSSLISEAEKISQDWKALGIKTKIKIINQIPEDFEALLAIWETPADPDQYSLWHSTQTSNLTAFANPKVDKLLEEGRKTFDETKRKEIYQEFQKVLVEECPAIFLFHPVTYTIIRE